MASGDELVKYITERVVTYIETPRGERPNKLKEPWSVKWFGMIPLGLTLWKDGAASKLKRKEKSIILHEELPFHDSEAPNA